MNLHLNVLPLVLLILCQAISFIYAAPGITGRVVHIYFDGPAAGKNYRTPRDSVPSVAIMNRLHFGLQQHYPYFDNSWVFSFYNRFNGTEDMDVFSVDYCGIGNCHSTWCGMDVDLAGNGFVHLGVGVLHP
ncbi:hypothetical protein FB446DRAFT_293333 [Lentinula raphanica]|nr:hypothetical protein FB446DRAFT_293333 [Lentinula raphanica]